MQVEIMNCSWSIVDPCRDNEVVQVRYFENQGNGELFFHYVTDFRVVLGLLDIFGGMYGATERYRRIVAPSWFGCYRVKVLGYKNALHHSTQNGRVNPQGYCHRCHGCCGRTHSELCNLIFSVSHNSHGEGVLCCFSDAPTAFGKCPSEWMVTSVPAFSNVIKPGDDGWDDTIQEILLSLLGRKEFVPSEKNGNHAPYAQPVLVFGQGGVGKSTFCSYLINQLLIFFDKVALLDTDLGQPILTPPGLVSLHLVFEPIIGPPHSLISDHSWENASSDSAFSIFNLASKFAYGVSPNADPNFYMTCIAECHLVYQQLVSGALSVVASSQNTQGLSLEKLNHIYNPYAGLSPLLKSTSCVSKLFHGSRGGEIQSLVEQFLVQGKEAQIPVPLIINTHGWVTGLGWQFIDAIGALTWSSWGIELVPPSMKEKKWATLEKSSDPPRSSSNFEEEIQKPLHIIRPPFQDLIYQYYGRLPLPWCGSSYTNLRRLTSAVNPKSNASYVPLSSSSQRWLRLAAYFNAAYRSATQVFPLSYEEFFHDCSLSLLIKSAAMFKAFQCRYVVLNLKRDVVSFPFFFCCPIFLNATGSNIDQHVVSCITAHIVALGYLKTSKDQASLRGSGEKSPPPYSGTKESEHGGNGLFTAAPTSLFKFFGYAWIHCVDLLHGEIYMYCPISLDPKKLSLVNVLAVGINLDFPSCPRGLTHISAFPDRHMMGYLLEDKSIKTSSLTCQAVEALNLVKTSVNRWTRQEPYKRSARFHNFSGGKKVPKRNMLLRLAHKK